MAATKKPTNGNGTNGRSTHNGHVSLAREEYDAYRALDERVSEQTIEHAKLSTRNAELIQTLDAQAKSLSNFDLKVTHLERITALQGVMIDHLKDKEKVLGLQELSEFWRQWTIFTSNAVDARKLERGEVEKFEPDLFKMWRNWVNDYGKTGRGLNIAGSRQEIEAKTPQTQAMLQAHLIAQQRAEIEMLAAKVQKLEAELGPLKQPETKQP